MSKSSNLVVVYMLRFLVVLGPFAMYRATRSSFQLSVSAWVISTLIGVLLLGLFLFESHRSAAGYLPKFKQKTSIEKSLIGVFHLVIYVTIGNYLVNANVHQLISDTSVVEKYVIPIGDRGKIFISCSTTVVVKDEVYSEESRTFCMPSDEYKNLLGRPIHRGTINFRLGSVVYKSSVLGTSISEIR